MDATRAGVPSAEDRDSRPTFVTSQPNTLLRRPGIRVTGRWFIVGSQRYDVTELSNLRTLRGPHDRLTVRAVVTTLAALALIGAVIVASSVGRAIQLAALPALAAALLVPVALAWVGYRLRPRPFELWAEHRGESTQLFYSDSEREYGQVCRALVRAREMARLGGAGEPLSNFDPWGSVPR
jgi:Family of unknown function (DUF6232)